MKEKRNRDWEKVKREKKWNRETEKGIEWKKGTGKRRKE